ncbi:MAG: XkdF-like putative serine protease domain-containing protein [Gammaproteobacteria bacterium]
MKRSQKSAEIVDHNVRIKRVDEAKRIVFGEVYTPNLLDTYSDFMSAEDIELMAHSGKGW